MEKLALIISLVSLAISFLAIIIAYNEANKANNDNKKDITNAVGPTKSMGAILFKKKRPEEIRFEKKLKRSKDNNDIKLDDLC